MKRTVRTALAALVCLTFLVGCSTMKTTWRDTRKWYRTYVNVNPSIDLTSQGISNKGLQRLAALFMPVDERLMVMMRALGCQDTPPEADWAQQFLSAYPWLSGVAVLDTSGLVRYQAPSVSLRPLDFAPLVEFADRYKARKLSASISTDEFGTMVMVAAPFSQNNEWTGLVVAYFDPRNLLRFSPDPSSLVVVSNDGTLWSDGAQGAEGLKGIDWNTILKSTVQGEMTVGGIHWVWVSRYIGQMNIVYLADANKAAQVMPENPLDGAKPADAASKTAVSVSEAPAPETATPAEASAPTPQPATDAATAPSSTTP